MPEFDPDIDTVIETAELERLRAELAQAMARAETAEAALRRDSKGVPVDDIWASLDHCASDRDAAIAERDRLAALLERSLGTYAWHDTATCLADVNIADQAPPCTCGYEKWRVEVDTAIAALPLPTQPPAASAGETK